MICRDCGSSISSDLRGCPTCALNLEFERKMDRVVWRVILPLLLLIVVGVVVLVYFMR